MVPCEDLVGSRLYAVEVSGWDNQQKFFVEKCDLAWDDDSGKQIELRRKLHDNALLFIRLSQTDDGERSSPVVYEAEWVGTGPNGQNQFRLSAVVPVIREQEVSLS
ncbi:MAG: hypothetical protein ABSH39_16235 [Candidatus Acidiferrum sp.]